MKKKKITTEEFIKRSKEIWGENTFDYSKVEYRDTNTKVTLICTKHSIEFKQTPSKHLNKKITCPHCLIEKKGQYKNGYWTYERCYEVAKKYECLSEFRVNENKCYDVSVRRKWLKDFVWLKRHYDEDEDIITAKKHLIYKYEFSDYNTVYIGLTVDLKRRSNQHKRFGSVYNFCIENNIEVPTLQIIEENLTLEEVKDREKYWIQHYKDLGYKLLNKTEGGDSIGTLHKVKTGKETDLFIEKARRVHGDKYSYEKVVYINNKTKVIIACPIHGEFLQIPNNHLRGQNCPKCSKRKKNNLVC